MTSRTDSSPRKIKRIQTQNNDETKNTQIQINDETKNIQTYQFFQQIISTCILLLKDEKDKLNYSSWLIRLNNEEKNVKILHLIKILCISIKNNHVYNIFTKPPPEDLGVLVNFEADHTVDMIESLRVITIEDNKIMLMDEVMLQNSKSKRSAAVTSDMLSYSLSKTSHYIVQSFYARSDFPIYTWYNPESIEVPSNIDHNQWELYLTRFNLLSQNKNKNRKQEINTCEEITKLDQVSKEVSSKFNWHPHSILFTSNRPKKSAAFSDVDAHVLRQPAVQQQIDEAAFAIVHNKSFPGLKMLNPKVYYTALMPEPVYEFKMTGVRITYNSISPCSFKSCTRQWVRVEELEEPKTICPTKKQKCLQNDVKSSCKKDDKTVIKQRCSTGRPAEAQPPCKRVTTLNVTDFRIQPAKESSIVHKNTATIKTENDSECLKAKKTDDECGVPLCKPKCQNTSSKPVCETKPKSECKLNVTDLNKNCQIVKRCDPPNPNKSLNDTTNYDWTKFSDEISVDEKWEPNLNSTRKNRQKTSNRSHVRRDNDQVAFLEPVNRNELVYNQTRTPIGQNVRKAETSLNRSSRCYQTQKCDEQRCDSVVNSSTIVRPPRANCTNVSPKRKSIERNEYPNARITSYDDLSDNTATQSDECSYNSQCSYEVDFTPPRKPNPDYNNCLATSTSCSTERRPNRLSESDYRGRVNMSTRDNSRSKYKANCTPTNATRCPERDVDDCDVIENDWDENRDGYIEDVSMPHMSFDSYAESQSRGFPECESRENLEDVSMPQLDYETSYSSDDCAYYEEGLSDGENRT